MIPFEREASLNKTERYVEELLRSNWEYVVRSTPGIKEDLEGRYPELAETISRKVMEDSESKFSNVFRPGVPDFLAFDDTGEYLFVEAKSEDDSLRHTQLKWLRDFQGVNVEIWFADTERDTEKLDGEEFEAYGFQDVKKDSSEQEVEQKGGKLRVSIPGEISAITGIEAGDTIQWRLKSGDELILDTR